MPPERQLEFFPPLRRTARQRKELIQKKLQGLEFRQKAREEKRRLQQERRRAREAGVEASEARQLTIDELIERSRAVEEAPQNLRGFLSRLWPR